MHALCLKGEVKKAFNLHDKVLSHGSSKVTYSILIDGLCKTGETKIVVQLLGIIEGSSTVIMYNSILDSLF